MRHQKRTVKLNRNGSHRRAMIANMLKALVQHGQIETTVAKAKALRPHADKLITMAKKNTLASRRAAIAKMMVSYNKLSSKETRAAKEGNTSSYNADRFVERKLGELAERYGSRAGGYTRIVRKENRQGDSSPLCIIEYVQ
ncbi:50S ribosomal protein L17 [Candidatus Neptunochlamydia vexilliferae]|uniref:Large ribosomal subunit protein bL17 n=1 Tax=Candidatus Neptunichlamydia vexilliferae TaxID=1651774 RepID=A0ABS0AY19_9BACT|nr:50S ribosomal protein L17 [Candidatus Neptunochlamydia vexilliferae]MBF5058860.1 50S ribosomal protein L17 [Candidatus Neptunochlamydia vexilliferae]